MGEGWPGLVGCCYHTSSPPTPRPALRDRSAAFQSQQRQSRIGGASTAPSGGGLLQRAHRAGAAAEDRGAAAGAPGARVSADGAAGDVLEASLVAGPLVPESRRWLDRSMRGRRTQAPELAHGWLQQSARAAADTDGHGAHSRDRGVALLSVSGGLALEGPGGEARRRAPGSRCRIRQRTKLAIRNRPARQKEWAFR